MTIEGRHHPYRIPGIKTCIYSREVQGLRMGACRIGKYTPEPSRVITFKEVDINVPIDLVTNGIRALPNDAGKGPCRVSVLSFLICLTRIL